eukprot:PhF_6_TR5933/c0_g1_i1/m.8579/K00020/mmsB, HIBADH; 3-hydroxyisobutyrate dehydrogenase
MLRRTFVPNAAFAFVGLGQMGSRMASHIVNKDKNNTLYLFDTVASGAEAVKSQVQDVSRVHVCGTVSDAVKNSDVVITMLPNGSIVKKVYTQEIFPSMKNGTTLLDCSTIEHTIPKELSTDETLRAKGCTFYDAPVSGGVNGAAAGTLTFMVGGDDFQKAKDILQLMGVNIVHCGGHGAGQVCKLANNLILAQSMLALSEAMLIATRLGIDPKVLTDIVNTSSGKSWASEKYNPCPGVLPNVPSSKNYEGGFACQLMLKDTKLAVNAAKAANVPTPGGDTALQQYQKIVDAGLGNKDFSFMYEYLNKQ